VSLLVEQLESGLGTGTGSVNVVKGVNDLLLVMG
jgi:hypothetical protein